MIFYFNYDLMQNMEKLGNEKISFYEHLEPLLECGKEYYATRTDNVTVHSQLMNFERLAVLRNSMSVCWLPV